ncbi:MAG: alpha/beta hydrolase [Sneathiellales bacterium]|nr:alpha/beta hydrolase [Sneathiellales bacterium]
MTLDPQAKWVLDIAEQAKAPLLEDMSAEDAKAAYEERAQKLCLQDVPIGKSEDLEIEGPHGPIPLRIYTPEGATGTLPVLVFYHGGGWVIGSRNSHDALCRSIANKGPFLIISVDYRMGPEAKFPAAVDDAYTALLWAQENAGRYSGDPSRIAVGGDSAGGNLSAVTCLMAKEKSTPLPVFQWLIYPATNMDMVTQSHTDFAEGYFLTKPLMEWFQGHYLTGAQDRGNWKASPLKAESLSGLPEALVQTAGFDPLKDEGKAFSDRLNAEGVRSVYTDYPGMIHGFINLGGAIDAAEKAVDEGVQHLKKAFGV